MDTKRNMFPFWFPLLFGLMSAARLVGNPRVAAIRGVDIVQLIATGMLFGVALASFAFLRRSRE